MATRSTIEYGPLRWSEYEQYKPVVSLAIDAFERRTGIDQNAEATIDQLSRRSIWFVLRLFRLLGRPFADILVARDGNGIVGTGMVLWLQRVAYVSGMATRPEARGRGIASRILSLLAEQARRRRRPWLALDVDGENDSAQRLYRRAGYQEAGTFTWFTRKRLPSRAEVPGSFRPRLVDRPDYADLATKLDASRPTDYRSAFPASERVLHHNEYLVRWGRLEHQTWRVDSPNGGIAVVRACYLRGPDMGVYFLMTTSPEPSTEEVLGGVDAATEWLRSWGPSRSLAMVPEPRGAVAAALEQRGFSSVASSRVMLRRVSG